MHIPKEVPVDAISVIEVRIGKVIPKLTWPVVVENDLATLDLPVD